MQIMENKPGDGTLILCGGGLNGDSYDVYPDEYAVEQEEYVVADGGQKCGAETFKKANQNRTS